MKALRANCVTGEISEVEVQYEIKYNKFLNENWLHITGGVTGYESMPVRMLLKSLEFKEGWQACFGTKNVWDSLVIPRESLQQIYDELKKKNLVRELI